MSLSLPPIPLIPPIMAGPKVDDVLVPDDKVHASKLIADETGWRGNDARIAVAVMGGESGYDPSAENYCCVGLLAVNVLVHNGKFGIPADKDKARAWAKDARNNVRAAYKIWLAQGWGAWEAYTNGSYKTFIGRDPIINVGKGSVSGGVAGAAGAAVDAALGPVDEIAGALLNPSTWLRVGKGALGGTLILVGTGALVFVIASKASKSPAVHKVARTVATKTPVGKAASVVT